MPSNPTPTLRLAGVLKEVARTLTADATVAARLDGILGLADRGTPVPAQAIAWQGILRGESEDFEACGSASLDEWAAEVVAGVIGQGSRAVRNPPGAASPRSRCLRSRGLCGLKIGLSGRSRGPRSLMTRHGIGFPAGNTPQSRDPGVDRRKSFVQTARLQEAANKCSNQRRVWWS